MNKKLYVICANDLSLISVKVLCCNWCSSNQFIQFTIQMILNNCFKNDWLLQDEILFLHLR
jgi:hypothetical protein